MNKSGVATSGFASVRPAEAVVALYMAVVAGMLASASGASCHWSVCRKLPRMVAARQPLLGTVRGWQFLARVCQAKKFTPPLRRSLAWPGQARGREALPTADAARLRAGRSSARCAPWPSLLSALASKLGSPTTASPPGERLPAAFSSRVSTAISAGMLQNSDHVLHGALLEVRFETPPGEQAQVDFASFEVECAEEPGMKRIVWLFSMVLGYSRLIWARFVLHQDLQSCAVTSPPSKRSAAPRARSSMIA
jgi:hypothetical protein